MEVLIPPHREEEGKLKEILPIVDSLHISRMAKATDFKFASRDL